MNYRIIVLRSRCGKLQVDYCVSVVTLHVTVWLIGLMCLYDMLIIDGIHMIFQDATEKKDSVEVFSDCL